MKTKQIVGTVLTMAMASTFTVQASETMGYLGIGFGQGDIDEVVEPFAGVTASQDTDGDTLRIYGGRQINDNFALEVGWIDFGNYGADLQGFGLTENFDVDAEAFFLNVVLSTPVDDPAAFYFKAGLYSWSVDVDDTISDGVNTVVVREGLDGNDTFFGFGAMLNPQSAPFSVRLGYEQYKDIGDDKDSDGEDVEVLSIDLLLRF